MSVLSPPEPRHDEHELLIREARARQRRRWVIAAAAVAIGAGVAVAASSVLGARPNLDSQARRGPALAGVSECRAGQLAVSLVRTGAVTGVEGGLLRFRNDGSASCRIAGWPTVAAVEGDGRTIPSTRAVRGTMLYGWNGLAGRPLPRLRLGQGGSAYAILASGDTPLGGNPPPSCPKARMLRVAPPKARSATALSGWLPNDVTDLPLCDRTIMVSPVLPLSAVVH